MGLPIIIMKYLAIPRGSYGPVVYMMLEIHAKHEARECYDPSGRIKSGRGRNVEIEDLTPQAEMAYRTIATGCSLGKSVVLVNQWRVRQN